jgi:ribosome biogenesis GTPase
MAFHSSAPTLAELGFDSFFAEQMPDPESWARLARVAVEHRGQYQVLSLHGVHAAVLSGRLRHTASEWPKVGDWVELCAANAQLIERVLRRRTQFARRDPDASGRIQVIAANIDVVLIVCASSASSSARVQRRGVNLSRLERYAAAVRQGGALPVYVVNKIDLASDVQALIASVVAIAGDATVLTTSALTGAGVNELRAAVPPRATLALCGASGVGKSALTNRLLDHEAERVGDVRQEDERGRHTTTHRELFVMPGGGLLIDTPGMRELGLVGELDAGFDDIARLGERCRFRDCRHTDEPGCAVIAAIAAGELDRRRLASLQKLERELARDHREVDPEARRRQRRAVKQRARAYRAHMRLKNRP